MSVALIAGVTAAKADSSAPSTAASTAASNDPYYDIQKVEVTFLGEDDLSAPDAQLADFMNQLNNGNNSGSDQNNIQGNPGSANPAVPLPTTPTNPNNPNNPKAVPLPAVPLPNAPIGSGGIGGIEGKINEFGQIVNIGKEIWDVVVANKPVTNISVDQASALPLAATDWTKLQSWQPPKAMVFQVAYKNGFGMNVVQFDYRVLYTYGGNIDGVGAFIAQATVVPANLNVSWGFTFNAKVSVPAVTNAGTSANPVGAAQLLLNWSVDSVLRHMQKTQSYYIRGDGAFQDISNGS